MFRKPQLSIIQYNTHNSRKVQNPFLKQEEIRAYDIIALQDPSHKGDTTHTPPTGYHTVFPSPRASIALFISKKLDSSTWSTWDPPGATLTDHIQTVTIETPIGRLHVRNIYNRPRLHTRDVLDQIDRRLRQPGEHLLLGDFNLHHPTWSALERPASVFRSWMKSVSFLIS